MNKADPSLVQLAEGMLDILCERFPAGYRPKIVWKPLRVSAGLAYFKQGTIGLSYLLLTDSERLERTLVHEYAHLLSIARHGTNGKGHGEMWRNTMQELGEKPEVYHRYTVERNQARQAVKYRCRTCGTEFERRRRLANLDRYRHSTCGGKLQLLGVERTC